MELWTDYEGRTVAGEYKLFKLRRSEGRNGFFSTADAKGHAAVIRLTEAHFDEEDQLSRWRKVAETRQSNLIGIEKVGRTELEGVALTYALMEADDAVLAEVLAERPLTAQETQQVALSVGSALAALHARNLVHEHVNAENVLAVGETVKLRSDCVRECVEDGEFVSAEQVAATRRKDVHDFGVLLLRCLTLETELKPGARLPEPFPRIIPGALDGTLTLERIVSTLAPPAPLQLPLTMEANGAGAMPATGTGANAPQMPGVGVRSVLNAPSVMQQDLPLARATSPRRFADEIEEPEAGRPIVRSWAVWAAGALVLLFVVWHFASSKPAAKSAGVAPSSPAAAPAPQTTAQPANVPVVVRHDAQAAPAAAPVVTSAGAGWRVIAFTFNGLATAQIRVSAIAARHPDLQPQVYSPSGHSPYLVSLGGAMSEAEAKRILHSARREGMPRDTFVRNYRVR